MSSSAWSKFPHGEPPYQPDLWNKLNPQIKATHNCYTYMLNDLYKVPRIYGKPQPGYFVDTSLFQGNRLSCKEVTKGVKADNPHIQTLSLKKGKNFKCPPNYYKGFMIVSPGRDYHFARQDNRMIKVYRSIHKDIYYGKVKLIPNKYYLISLFLIYCIKEIPEIVKLANEIYKNKIQSEKDYLKYIYKCSRTWSHKPGGTDATDKDASGKLILDPEKANWNYSKSGGINYSKHCCYYSVPSNNIALTYSSGIPITKFNKKKNNPHDVRNNLSVDKAVDSKYEKLIKSICK